MAKLKNGQRLVCEPCGTEVIVDSCGVYGSSIMCCGKPMTAKAKTNRKKKK